MPSGLDAVTTEANAAFCQAADMVKHMLGQALQLDAAHPKHITIAQDMARALLFNNKKKKERKDMIKYERKWTPRQVIYQQKCEEVLKRIKDESGAKPGGPSMFKHYQAAVKGVMAELSDAKLEKAKETAEEWSNNFPPPKIQA
ncbi:hypothetical protein EDB19DRAFT_1918360 [Suillus lakei]|nr:hypothetical protein EDB19DRAFT_1918360 [Suillus lakei]